MLVVTTVAAAPNLRADDRAGEELLAGLARRAEGRLTVMTTERAPAADRHRWAAAGLEVIEGPEAWDRRWTRRYSHVVMTADAARSSAREWLARAQPQAHRVLYFPSLPLRQVTALAPVTRPDEMNGLIGVALDAQRSLAGLAGWAHTVWCRWEADAPLLRSWAPQVPVRVVPAMMRPRPDRPPPGGRAGLLVVAAEGADVVAGDEDAAHRVVNEVLPQIRAGDPRTGCTVVSDQPTPALAEACRRAGAALVPTAEMDAQLAAARVLLGGHRHGTGQPAVIMAALEAGLAVVATRHAIGDLDLPGPILAVDPGAADLAVRARQLLADDGLWVAAIEAADREIAGRYGADHHERALASALAEIGITPQDEPPRPPVARRPVPAAVHRPPAVPLRPRGAGPAGDADSLDGAVSPDEAGRYRLWQQRWGAHPAALAALSAELATTTHRPRISVLMAVADGQTGGLGATAESLRAQIYDDWQLCAATEGTAGAGPIELPADLGHDPRVSVVARTDSSGPGRPGPSYALDAALERATGDYVMILEPAAVLAPHALAQVARWLAADPAIDVVYADEDRLAADGGRSDPYIKPDWSPERLMAHDYVGGPVVARRTLVEAVGGLRPAFDGAHGHDLLLRLAEITDRIAHIPEPLLSSPAGAGPAVMAGPGSAPFDAGRRAVQDALRRRGYGDRVDVPGPAPVYRPRYPIPGTPKVSIIVPTRDGRPLLDRCIGSVIDRTSYPNYEIVIVDNESRDGATLAFLARGPWRVIRYPHRFNYARMMNLAARSVDTDALLFLNNDTEIVTSDWIEGLLEHAMRPEVGAVGGRLYFGDGTAQHEGIMLGIGGWAHNAKHDGYQGRGDMIRDVSAVTGACTMIRPSVYRRVGGNDERLRIAYNDVDLCLRIRQAGYRVVYTPYVELYHHESSTRGSYDHEDEGPFFGARWRVKETVDPYYSPMFEDYPPFVIRV